MNTHTHNALESVLMDYGLSSTQAAEVAYQTTPYAQSLLLEALKARHEEAEELKEQVQELKEQVDDEEDEARRRPDLPLLRRSIHQLRLASQAMDEAVEELLAIQEEEEER